MKLKRLFYIFLFGLFAGIIVSPFVKGSPIHALLSPISPSLADTEILSPLSDGQVLGTQTEEESLPVMEKESKFADLLALKISVPEEEKPVSEKPLNPDVSDYSGKITVAVYGDSMVDLMGTNLPYLHSSLKNYYPKAKFVLLNYGIGAENIEKGIERLDKKYSYKDRSYPSILDSHADVIVVESFAYNPMENIPEELTKHWANMATIVEKLKTGSSKIIILTTIAPSLDKFGQGIDGVNWPKDTARDHAQRIINLLANTVKFAKSSRLPLSDAFHPSLTPKGDGDLSFIKVSDHIHQSDLGNKLIADILAKTIYNILDR